MPALGVHIARSARDALAWYEGKVERSMMKVLVTGGAGFIGSAVCRLLVGELGATVLNVDRLTYAANLGSLRPIEANSRYMFRRADICDRQAMLAVMREFEPDAVLHLAAEFMSTARSTDRPISSGPTSRAPGFCSTQHSPTGGGCRRNARPGSGFITFRPTRFSVLWGERENSPRPRGISRTRLTPRQRRLPTTSSGRGARPSSCRPSSATAPTITAPTTSRRN